jgi:hypothetical protein
VILNVKEVLAPAGGLDGETATAKHLADDGQVDVCPAAGDASIAAPSMLAATKKEIRPTLKPDRGMVTPSPGSTNEHEPSQNPALPEDPAMHSHVHWGCWTVQLCIRQVAAPHTTLGADGDRRKN